MEMQSASAATVTSPYAVPRSAAAARASTDERDLLWDVAREMADAAHDRPGSHPDTFTGVTRRKHRWRIFRSLLAPQRRTFDRKAWSAWLVDMGWVDIAGKDVVTRRCWHLQNKLVESGLVEGIGSGKEPVPLDGWIETERERERWRESESE